MSTSWSSLMTSTIKEALYLFELKGEFSLAISKLKEVSQKGSPEEQVSANFYLGKIYDISGNASTASFYYTQCLMHLKNTSDAYWIAEQLARLQAQPEPLIQNHIPLKVKDLKVFPSFETSYLVLDHTKIVQMDSDHLDPVLTPIPVNAQIHFVSEFGVWYSTPTHTLCFQPLNALEATQKYSLDSKIQDFILLPKNKVFVLTENKALLISHNNSPISLKNSYQNCTITGFYKALDDIILNCPDNTLRFIHLNSLSENFIISQLDSIEKIIIDSNSIFLFSDNTLWHYLPNKTTPFIWKHSNTSIKDFIVFSKHLVLLEHSGKLKLIEKKSGLLQNSINSEATWILEMAPGLLGSFSKSGNISALDTALTPLWSFNLGKPLKFKPFINNTSLCLSLNDSLVLLNAMHYGKKPLQSTILAAKAHQLANKKQWEELSIVLDTLIQIEAGSLDAWFLKALLIEETHQSEKLKQSIWAKAIQLVNGDKKNAPLVLSRYSKIIDAQYVKPLSISSKITYPQFFGSSKNLYTIDLESQQLQNIDPETGEKRWFKNLDKLDKNPVMANNDSQIAIASGFKTHIYELQKNGYHKELNLSGKPFHIEYTHNAIYISTWNGFLEKFLLPQLNLAWSRKIFNTPFHFSNSNKNLWLSSLEGELLKIWSSSGLIQDTLTHLHSTITHTLASDSLFIVANNNNKVFIFSTLSNKLLKTIQVPSSINSIQVVNTDNLEILMGLSNQQIILYSLIKSNPLWVYSGTGSIFVNPIVHQNLAWVDQKNKVIALDLKTGNPVHEFKTQSNISTPFILEKKLFTASDNQLLYAFEIPY